MFIEWRCVIWWLHEFFSNQKCTLTVPDIVDADPSVSSKNFTLTGHFSRPLFDGKLLSKTVANTVTGNFMAVWVYILHMAVISPFVWHVKCGRNGTPVGVPSDRVENALIEFLVEVIEAVVKGKDDQLWCFYRTDVAWKMLQWIQVRQCQEKSK